MTKKAKGKVGKREQGKRFTLDRVIWRAEHVIIFGSNYEREKDGRQAVVLEKIKVRAEESSRLIKKSIHIFAFQDRPGNAVAESDEDKDWLEERKKRVDGS